MRLEGEAIVVAVRAHGEHGAIVRCLTEEAGVVAGYVRGGRSRRLRPVLMPGNLVHAEFRARNDDQLAYLAAELVHSRAFLLGEPLAAAAIEWACALTAAALAEGQAYPRLFEGLDGLLRAIEAAPSARGWAAALVRFELLILAELGFGAGRDRLRQLAPELREGSALADWAALRAGLAFTGDLLARDLLTGRSAGLLAARERLVDRLKRAGS